MAERRARRGSLQVHFDYTFDRLRESKLAQAYDILVPGRERLVGARAKETDMKMAAIYARVSSEQQREEHTIASQTAALIEFAKSHDLEVPEEWVFEDEGYSGATLERPGLSGCGIWPPKARSRPCWPMRRTD